MKNNGMKTFTIVWFGQLVSYVGTAMTRFALLIWAYQQTGNATTVALLGFFTIGPSLVIGPLAGVWVDRLNRRLVMLAADLGAGLMTIAMLLLFATGSLEIWHLYVAEALTGIFEVFQIPAYTAATTLMIPKEKYARASGMRSMATSASQVVAPFLGGLLLTVIDIDGVMLIDVATFLIAVGTLIWVRFPQLKQSEESKQKRESVWQEMRFGFRYIYERPGLRGLLLIFMGINLFATLTYFAILPAMILARSGGSEFALGSVQAALGGAGIIGGLMITIWGGPKRKIHGVLIFAALSFVFGDFLFAVGRSLPVWIIAASVASIFIPFIVASNRTIWQSKVAPEVQGRVFAIQTTLQEFAMPIGFLVAGPLADHLFEPAMMPDGRWADLFGWLVGTGAGSGMGLMFACTAFLGFIMSLSGYLSRSVRNIEDDLPDHDAITTPVAA